MATACSTIALKYLTVGNGVGTRNRKVDLLPMRRAGQIISSRNGINRHSSLRVVTQAAASTVETEQKKAEAMQSNYQMNTLTKWLLQQERAGVIDNELTIVLNSIAVACKQIASLVNRAGISNLTGLQGETNVQGEDQKKLDVVSNEVFKNCMTDSGRTSIIASEEEDVPVPVAIEENYSGRYICVFDPLDGSSNIDAGISVGSIFGIYSTDSSCIPSLATEGMDESIRECVAQVCQPGDNLLAAGYCMYSSSTVLVLSIGTGVYGFTLDPLVGEYVLTHNKIQVPEEGSIYSFNEGNADRWSSGLKEYMSYVKSPPSGKPYSARYIGSLVGDFHRTLLYGGVYGYPSDTKNANGKLRLLYECAPMSFLAEQAGGKGSDGSRRVLDIVPEEVHQRVPLFVGSKKEVELIEKFLADNDA